MRLFLALVPSLLFLVAHVGMAGLRDPGLARLQLQANLITGEMNRLSANASEMIQRVSLGTEEEGLQAKIDEANRRMADMRDDLHTIWSAMDVLKVKATQDALAARILKMLGVLSGVATFLTLASFRKELAPYGLVASALMLGLSAA
jgi:hypothetical protein